MKKKVKKMPVLRIVGGQWRGRKLPFHAAEGLRPSGDRVRETLFNWLQWDVRGSRCLDLFAGSGALGFEAASRGAAHVVMVDNNVNTVRQLNANRQQLCTTASQAGLIEIVHADAMDYLCSAPQPFDIIFIDPPFAQKRVTETCAMLNAQGLLMDDTLVYVETPYKQAYQIPVSWSEHKSSRAGQVAMNLYLNNQTPCIDLCAS